LTGELIPVTVKLLRLEVPVDPAGALAVRQLLGIAPLNQEFVGRVEVGGDGPFAEVKRRVSDRGIVLYSLEIWGDVELRSRKKILNILQMVVRYASGFGSATPFRRGQYCRGARELVNEAYAVTVKYRQSCCLNVNRRALT
jgi:hypothetical protein